MNTEQLLDSLQREFIQHNVAMEHAARVLEEIKKGVAEAEQVLLARQQAAKATADKMDATKQVLAATCASLVAMQGYMSKSAEQ